MFFTGTFTIHLENANKKCILLEPRKKLRDVAAKICFARKLNLNDFDVKRMDGSLINYTDATTLEDIATTEVLLALKRKIGCNYFNTNDKNDKIITIKM